MPDESGDDDADLPLVQRAQAGDLDAFDNLAERHQAMITGILYRFAPDRADLEDMVQDTFVRAWKALPQWTPEKPFIHWLKRIAVNVGMDFCNKQARKPLGNQADNSDEHLSRLSTDTIEEESTRTAVEKAQYLLSQASPEDRALLTLLYLNEMSIAEVAEHFGWSQANTKIKAYRARKRLKLILDNHEYRFD